MVVTDFGASALVEATFQLILPDPVHGGGEAYESAFAFLGQPSAALRRQMRDNACL
jgi:hypothetical protein